MRYSDPRERVRIREALVVAQPDRLRIEIISAFGVALRITSNGRELRAWHGGDKTFYRGAASAENLARFTRLSLEVRQIVDILLGLPPLRKASGPPRVELETATRLWRMAQPLPGGGRQNFWFDLERPLAIRAEEVDRDGDRLYLVAYRDYRDVTGVSLPFEIALEIPEQEATISLAYEDVRLNEPVGDDLFSFEPPEGARTVDLDAEDGVNPTVDVK